jgi:tetratricopeptide (TPR) repeat protein
VGGNYQEALKYFEITTTVALKYFEAAYLSPQQRLDTLDFMTECRHKIEESRQHVAAMEKGKIRERIDAASKRAQKFYSRGYYEAAQRELADARVLVVEQQFDDMLPGIETELAAARSALVQSLCDNAGTLEGAGKLEEAAGLYKKAKNLLPDNHAAKSGWERLSRRLSQQMYEQGIAAFASNDITGARAAFARSLEFDPSRTEARRALERLPQ